MRFEFHFFHLFTDVLDQNFDFFFYPFNDNLIQEWDFFPLKSHQIKITSIEKTLILIIELRSIYLLWVYDLAKKTWLINFLILNLI